MELIYNIIDYLIVAAPIKQILVILGILVVLIPIVSVAYLLFRNYDLLALVITSAIVLWVSFDSVIERREMRKSKQQQ